MANFPVDLSPKNAVAINLASDTTLANCRGIWVGSGGSIKVDMASTGTAITFTNVQNGYLSGNFSKIYSTANGTTASNLVVVW